MHRLKVFVYGTLMEGLGNNPVLGENATLIGEHKVEGFELFPIGGGWFPAMLKDPHHDPEAEEIKTVSGEIWEIDKEELEQLDALEGAPHMYTRETYWSYDHGDLYYYLWVDETELRKTTNPIEDGSWREHLKRQKAS